MYQLVSERASNQRLLSSVHVPVLCLLVYHVYIADCFHEEKNCELRKLLVNRTHRKIFLKVFLSSSLTNGLTLENISLLYGSKMDPRVTVFSVFSIT